MRLFELRRGSDNYGCHVGVVAQGVIFDSGACVLTWLGKHRSVCVYEGVDDVIAVHGHDSLVVQIADVDKGAVRRLLDNRLQDIAENTDVGLDSTGRYLWGEREAFAALMAPTELKNETHRNAD